MNMYTFLFTIYPYRYIIGYINYIERRNMDTQNIKNNKSHCIHNPISSTNNRKTIRTDEEKKTITNRINRIIGQLNRN